MFPNTVHDCLVRSGLTDANGELDVNPNTLKTKKFDNIYGLGDVTNVPTTKTFWGGFRQVAVLRHNLARKSQGLS